MTGVPDKEYGTNKPPPTRRARERSKGDTACPSTSQNPSRWHPSWLSTVCTTRKDSELEWLVKDHPETNPITIKPDIVSHAAEQFSWVPLPYCSPPWCPFPVKSLALSAHVSPWIIHFRVLDKSPVSGPGRGPPSCNRPAGVINCTPLSASSFWVSLFPRTRDYNTLKSKVWIYDLFASSFQITYILVNNRQVADMIVYVQNPIEF